MDVATIKVEPRPEVEEEVEEVHTYVGASHDFKERNYRHRTSFNNPTYRTDTTLSKCVWKLKEDNRQFTIKWRIIDRGAAYRPSSKRCNLCLKEKYWIIFRLNLVKRAKFQKCFFWCFFIRNNLSRVDLIIKVVLEFLSDL